MGGKFNPGELTSFAQYYGFHYDICDPKTLIRDCLNDMERGLRGQPSDLPMRPAYINPSAYLPREKTVIALDAGGTNLRAALVRVGSDGKLSAGEVRKAPMPGTKGQVGAGAFFDRIADIAIPLIREAGSIDGIGFCFSYSIEITKDADAVLVSFSKEVDAPEVVGKYIGAELREALARKGVKITDRIVLMNDTVATLLSALANTSPIDGGGRGPVIGFILGTGFNTAYLEKSIPKIGFFSEESPQIVVCETCSYHPRFLGYLDREFDASTKCPRTYMQEKVSAGAYLGPLTLFVLKQAVRDGILNFSRSGELLAMDALATADLNAFLQAPLRRGGPLGSLFAPDEEDALAAVVYLASIVTERGALISAAVLAATVERMEAGFNPFAPVRIAVEGTTYMAYKGMREALESHLRVLLNKAGPRSYTIAPVEQASLFGAAMAAFSKVNQ
jgi:hexokinase